MSEDARFIQIACGGTSPDGPILFALDEAGIVWEFVEPTRAWVELPVDRLSERELGADDPMPETRP